ncbi:hypothetical protein [Nostoc sp.]|uniref:hypothetical protein n=1 Tax=Nostoc sp. TaxID=1180 RepID=UPI002FFCB784
MIAQTETKQYINREIILTVGSLIFKIVEKLNGDKAYIPHSALHRVIHENFQHLANGG